MTNTVARSLPILAGGSLGDVLNFLLGKALQAASAAPRAQPIWSPGSQCPQSDEPTEVASCELCEAGVFDWPSVLLELPSRGNTQQGFGVLVLLTIACWTFLMGIVVGATGACVLLGCLTRYHHRDRLQGYVATLARAGHG